MRFGLWCIVFLCCGCLVRFLVRGGGLSVRGGFGRLSILRRLGFLGRLCAGALFVGFLLLFLQLGDLLLPSLVTRGAHVPCGREELTLFLAAASFSALRRSSSSAMVKFRRQNGDLGKWEGSGRERVGLGGTDSFPRPAHGPTLVCLTAGQSPYT